MPREKSCAPKLYSLFHTAGFWKEMEYWKRSVPACSMMESRWPPPRKALPRHRSFQLDGQFQKSKFPSVSETWPMTPDSLPTPAPSMRRPVGPSLTRTTASRIRPSSGSRVICTAGSPSA